MTQHKPLHFHLLKPQRQPKRQPKPRNVSGGEWFFVNFWLWYQLTNFPGLTTYFWFSWFALTPDFTPPDVQLDIDNLLGVYINYAGDLQREWGPFTAAPSGLAGSASHFDFQHSSASATVSAGQPTLNNIDIRIVGAGTTIADSGSITLGGSGLPGQANLLIEYAGDLFTPLGTWSLVGLFPISWSEL
jgi:hypothetical protein